MQLTVVNGKYPAPNEYIQSIDNDDTYACQQFLRRRKYRIFVGFLEASMINPVDGPVEFEVSIGKKILYIKLIEPLLYFITKMDNPNN